MFLHLIQLKQKRNVCSLRNVSVISGHRMSGHSFLPLTEEGKWPFLPRAVSCHAVLATTRCPELLGRRSGVLPGCDWLSPQLWSCLCRAAASQCQGLSCRSVVESGSLGIWNFTSRCFYLNFYIMGGKQFPGTTTIAEG